MNVFAVQRQNWRRYPEGVRRLPGWVEVQAFTDRDSAEAFAAEEIARYRATVNPFELGDSLFDVTRLAPYALHDWLMDHDFTPPPSDAERSVWASWWTALSAAERERAWPAFDKLQFCAVTERPAELAMVGYTIEWLRNQQFSNSATFEGGRLRFIARHGYNPNAWLDRHTRPPARQYGNYDYALFHLNSRANFLKDFADNPLPDVVDENSPEWNLDIPWCGIEEVPAFDLAAAPAFVVARFGFHERPNITFNDGTIAFPVAAFGSRVQAEQMAWQLDVEARRYLNPFRYGHPQRLTSLPEHAYRGMLQDLQLELPATGWPYVDSPRETPLDPEWIAWYEHAVCLITDEQREMIWDLLDNLRFYTVVELEYRT